MERRRFLFAVPVLSAALAAGAEPHAVPPELAERIGDLAAALADGNAGEFLHQFDKRMPGFEDFSSKVRALVDVAQLVSSVKPFSEVIRGSRHVIEADWSLQVIIRDRPAGTGGLSPAGTSGHRPGETEERKQTVTLTLEKQGRRWRFVDIRPRSLFDPPAIQ